MSTQKHNEPNKAVYMTSSDITVWKQVRIRFTQDLFSQKEGHEVEKEVMKCLCDLKHKKIISPSRVTLNLRLQHVYSFKQSIPASSENSR